MGNTKKSSGPIKPKPLSQKEINELADFGLNSKIDFSQLNEEYIGKKDEKDSEETLKNKRVKKHIEFNQEDWKKVNPINKKIIKDWIFDAQTKSAKQVTITQYYSDIKLVALYLFYEMNNISFIEVTKKQWQMYMLYLMECGISPARSNRIFASIRSILSFLEDSEDYPEYEYSTASKIKGRPKQIVKPIVFLEDSDFMILYNYLMKHKMYREATFIALAYESAGRRGELAQVKRDSISDDRNNTNVVIGKRSKKFQLIYFDLTKKAAKKWEASRWDHNDMLFVNDKGETMTPSTIYSMTVKLKELFFEITGRYIDFNVHSLRHSALENYNNGTHEVLRNKKMEGIPLEKLKHISHHSSIEVCSGYLRDKSLTELEELFNIKMV